MPDMSRAKSGQVLVRTPDKGVRPIVLTSMPPDECLKPCTSKAPDRLGILFSRKSGQVSVRTLVQRTAVDLRRLGRTHRAVRSALGRLIHWIRLTDGKLGSADRFRARSVRSIEKSGQVSVRTMSQNPANSPKILGVCQEF